MPRIRRTWGELRTEIRRLVREPDPDGSFWSQDDVLTCFNHQRDLLEIVLSEAYEGYNTRTDFADLVSGQRKYQLPPYTNRLLRVLLVTSDGLEIPLKRDENYDRVTSNNSNGWGCVSGISYAVRGEFFYLDPVPSENVTNGLKLELEVAQTQVSAASDQAIPSSWPILCETLLCLRTAIQLFNIESAMGPAPEGLVTSLKEDADLYAVQLTEFLETRSRGVINRRAYYSE